jgi:hypothetical protein
MDHGLPQMTKRDYMKAMKASRYSLYLLKDTAKRVYEIIEGAKPMSGKPEIPQ